MLVYPSPEMPYSPIEKDIRPSARSRHLDCRQSNIDGITKGDNSIGLPGRGIRLRFPAESGELQERTTTGASTKASITGFGLCGYAHISQSQPTMWMKRLQHTRHITVPVSVPCDRRRFRSDAGHIRTSRISNVSRPRSQRSINTARAETRQSGLVWLFNILQRAGNAGCTGLQHSTAL